MDSATVEFLHLHRQALNQLSLGLNKKSLISDAAQMRALVTDLVGRHGPAGADVAELSRAALDWRVAQAAGKLPAGWLADSTATQQATPAAVAAYRAEFLCSLFPTATFVDVTCSVGTEVAAIAHAGGTARGSDYDAGRLAMARHNVPQCHFEHMDALQPAPWLAAALHSAREYAAGGGDPAGVPVVIVADPARRAGGQRIVDPEQLQPPLSKVVATYAEVPVAIKCAPGVDFSQWPGLVDVVSVNGAVKEACLYSPEVSAAAAFGPQPRRAVVISETAAGPGEGERLSRRVEVYHSVDPVSAPEELVGPVGRFIVEPDGAVIRAGLVQHYAHRWGLHMVDPHIAFLTGERVPVGGSGFPVREVVPLKQLKAAVKKQDAGSAEILVRGVDVDPDRLRSQLKLKGTNPIGIIVARVGENRVAYVCGPREWDRGA